MGRDDYPNLAWRETRGSPEARDALDEIERLRSHARSLHRLNGWSKAKGWWCSCGATIVARSMTGETIIRPWSPEGRHSAEIRHLLHTDEAIR